MLDRCAKGIPCGDPSRGRVLPTLRWCCARRPQGGVGEAVARSVGSRLRRADPAVQGAAASGTEAEGRSNCLEPTPCGTRHEDRHDTPASRPRLPRRSAQEGEWGGAALGASRGSRALSRPPLAAPGHLPRRAIAPLAPAASRLARCPPPPHARSGAQGACHLRMSTCHTNGTDRRCSSATSLCPARRCTCHNMQDPLPMIGIHGVCRHERLLRSCAFPPLSLFDHAWTCGQSHDDPCWPT